MARVVANLSRGAKKHLAKQLGKDLDVKEKRRKQVDAVEKADAVEKVDAVEKSGRSGKRSSGTSGQSGKRQPWQKKKDSGRSNFPKMVWPEHLERNDGVYTVRFFKKTQTVVFRRCLQSLAK